jgi:hypothetical protein
MPKAEVVDITSRRPNRDGALRRMQRAALPFEIVRFCAAYAALGSPALCAAPPPDGSIEQKSLGGFDHWFRSQTGSYGPCCSLADGRIVEWRIVNDHYEVTFVHPELIDSSPAPQPGKYYQVDDKAVLHGDNPTGYAIAWWAHIPVHRDDVLVGHIRCFIPQTGT